VSTCIIEVDIQASYYNHPAIWTITMHYDASGGSVDASEEATLCQAGGAGCGTFESTTWTSPCL
jgi:hypothetical protein